jgi:hypothetical protein
MHTIWLFGVISMLRTRIGFVASLTIFSFVCGCEDKRTPLQTQPTNANRNDGDAAEAEGPPPSPGEREEALKRLDKAIAAHGGAKTLEKLKTSVQTLKGLMFATNLGAVPTEQQLKIHFPAHLRLTSKLSLPDGVKTVHLGVSNNRGWYGPESSITEMTEPVFVDHLGELHLRRVQTLLPLRDDEFRLKPVNGIEVDGKPTLGIRVIHKKWPPVNLYFDQKSSLLVRSVGPFVQGGSTRSREMSFLDYKLFDSLNLPTHIVERLDFVTTVDCSVDYFFPAKIDEKEFEAP